MHRRPEFTRIRSTLAASVHFKDLRAGELDALAGLCRLRRFRDGELIAAAGHPVNELWIVLGGAVRLSGVTHEGDEFVYAVLGRGSFYGLGYVIRAMSAIADARAYAPTELAVMDGTALIAMLDDSPRLWRHVCALLTLRLSLAMSVIRDLSVASLAQRIARRLLGQAMSSGWTGGAAASPIELRVSQTDLGRMLGASRSNINTELKQLEGRGLIRIGYRTLTLTDPAGLLRISGPDVFAF